MFSYTYLQYIRGVLVCACLRAQLTQLLFIQFCCVSLEILHVIFCGHQAGNRA